MTQKKPTRSKTYTRLRLHIFSDAASSDLDQKSVLMRLVCTCFAVEDPTQTVDGQPQTDVGWLVSDQGVPFTTRRLAKLSALTEDEVRASLDDLESLGLVVQADSGAWGVTAISTVTRAPSTPRVKASRTARAAA